MSGQNNRKSIRSLWNATCPKNNSLPSIRRASSKLNSNGHSYSTARSRFACKSWIRPCIRSYTVSTQFCHHRSYFHLSNRLCRLCMASTCPESSPKKQPRPSCPSRMSYSNQTNRLGGSRGRRRRRREGRRGPPL